ncbi:MAG: hypothetical protein DLM59_13355 [Pseudonocardiales bacterium]|nr:MAG: hypothetical protein DLM59_13355 [Pseudonocardiales bacterium]
MPDLSPEARARAGRTIEVSAVFAGHADEIVAALPDVPDGHVLVALVNHEHNFTGTHHVDKASMVERVPELEGPDGWAMVFTPGATAADVHRRTSEMADIAGKRIAAIDRIIARRGTDAG